MNKKELIAAVAEKAGITKKDAGKAVEAFMGTVKETLKANDKVTLIGFGTFETRKRAARKGRNPQTGKMMKIKASKNAAFKAGKAFKDLLN